MDLIQLDIFCRVFKERSFSRAAESLGLAQPTISIRIKELEEAIGTPLFNRLGREIEPTGAGKFLYEQALPLLQLQRKLSEKMASFMNRIEGLLVVGTSSVPGEHLLPSIMMRFQAQHPEVRVRLRFASESARTLDELRNGDIELGVIGAASERDDVVMEPFGTDSLVLITPASGQWHRGSTIALADLKAMPLIMHGAGSATRESVAAALRGQKSRLADLNVVAELGRTGAIKEAVRLGYGVAFVSSRTVSTEVEAGTLKIAQVPELGTIERAISIVYGRLRELSPTARAFLECLRSAASEARDQTKHHKNSDSGNVR